MCRENALLLSFFFFFNAINDLVFKISSDFSNSFEVVHVFILVGANSFGATMKLHALPATG